MAVNKHAQSSGGYYYILICNVVDRVRWLMQLSEGYNSAWGLGRQAGRHALLFDRGNVMILDTRNQKQAINEYAKMGSNGFLGENMC